MVLRATATLPICFGSTGQLGRCTSITSKKFQQSITDRNLLAQPAKVGSSIGAKMARSFSNRSRLLPRAVRNTGGSRQRRSGPGIAAAIHPRVRLKDRDTAAKKGLTKRAG